jgi:predicted nucleotidyltransferase
MTTLKEKERRLDYLIFRSFLQVFLKKLKGNMKHNLLAVVLYGSIARGKAHRESDIDLLILYRKGDFDTDEAYAVSVIESRESREYRALFEKDIYGEISPLFMTLEELSSNPLILLDIMEEGIILFERNHCFTKIVKKMRKKIKKMGSRKVTLPDGSWYWELKPEWKPGELIEVAL